MTHDEVMDAFEERAAAGAKAEQEQAFRPAAGFFALTMDITPMKRIEAQLEQLAHHDTLTGLANRRYFEEKLLEFLLQRDQGPFALLFLDIDQFKAINDVYGHATGDAALKHFGDCLKTCVRATDTVARLAGDEFVVVLPGLHNREDAERIARKIIREVRLGFAVNGEALTMTTSIGIAYAREASVTSEETLRDRGSDALCCQERRS